MPSDTPAAAAKMGLPATLTSAAPSSSDRDRHTYINTTYIQEHGASADHSDNTNKHAVVHSLCKCSVTVVYLCITL